MERDRHSRIADFYAGKTLFLTGAAGFLGVVLLEILLRCCPGIQCIYILLREKKGVNPQSRKSAIFRKKIFCQLQPELQDKVCVVAGDVSLPDLGMSTDDLLRVTQEATIVFHCAATISFLKPLRFVLLQNAVGTDNVVEFCRRLKNLHVLVYTSTAFSNSNRKDEIEETIYRLPFSAQRYLDEIRKNDDEALDRLFSQSCPKWPNFYTFSKSLAENILADKAFDLPVAIVRPSVITSIWKGIVPGYVEEGSGMVGLGLGIGKGFIRVLRVDTTKKIDHVPVDVVANTHVVAAWSIATERSTSPLVLNCTSDEVSPCTWAEYVNSLYSMTLEHPLPKAYQNPSITLCKNPVYYSVLSAYEHYIPAIAIDGLLSLSGRKPKLVSLYQYFDKTIKSIDHFVMNEWRFYSAKFRSLAEQMNAKDKEAFYISLDEYSVKALIKDLPYGAPFYQWDIDKKQYAERMRTVYVRNLLTTSIKWVALSCLLTLCSLLVIPLLQIIMS